MIHDKKSNKKGMKTKMNMKKKEGVYPANIRSCTT